MEPEKQRLVWQDTSSAALLISSGKTADQTINLACRLVEKASNHEPQLLGLQSIPIALGTARLEIWAHCLAAELMQQWQTLTVSSSSITTILTELGLISVEGKAPLIDLMGKAGAQTFPVVELQERLQKLYKHQQQEKLQSSQFRTWIAHEASRLADWFHQMPTANSLMFQSPEEMSGCLVKLQLYAPTLHTQTLQTLNACFSQLRLAGSQVILVHLKRLSQALQDTLNDYEFQRQERLRRESGAWRAYHNLMTQIETHQWGASGKGNLAWEAVLRALNLIYVSKLEAEAYTLGSQIVSDLIMQTRQYAAGVADTDTLLTRLHHLFMKQYPPESTLSPVLKSFLVERINPWDLRRQLEKWTGYPLLQWGTAKSIQQEALREQILAQLQPICWAVYGECCASLALGVSASNIKLTTVGENFHKSSHSDLSL